MKSRSEEDLSKPTADTRLFVPSASSHGSINGIATTEFIEFNSNNSGTASSSTYELTPPSTPSSSMKLNKQVIGNDLSPNLDNRRESTILQLNNDTNTWKQSGQEKSKNVKRPKHQNSRAKSKQNSWMPSFIKLKQYLISENAPEFRFRVIVSILFFIIVALVLITRFYHFRHELNKSIANQIYMHKSHKLITFIDKDGEKLLNIHYGINIPDDIPPVNCRSINRTNILCLDWKYRTHLSVQFSRQNYNNSFKNFDPVTCYKFRWQSYEKYSTIKDCFDMSDSHWFGIGDVNGLRWPLNSMSVPTTPFVTNHQTTANFAGSIIGRTWFLSKGVSITVPLEVPLFISINSTDNPNKLCFISKKQAPYYTTNLNNYLVHMEYSVCLAQNLSTLQNYMFETGMRQRDLKQDLNVPKSEKLTNNSLSVTTTTTPSSTTNRDHWENSENIFLDRILWSTNINVLPNFTQQTVQSYVDQITNYGLAGIILLDSRWENSIGELKMNEAVFNNPKVLVNILHNKGFKIMLTISANVALRSQLVDTASNYIFLDSNLRTPLLTRCMTDQEHVCALINFTNPNNGERFRANVEQELLNQHGLAIDGIFFQGIQSSLIPRHINFDRSINPDKFTEYTNLIIKKLPTSIGMSTSVHSTDYSGYVTIYPRNSDWKSLQSIIPSVLSLGLLGYPLVNSGIVGGQFLFTELKNETDYTNKELYLRWLQLVIFLPVVQLAEPPGGNDLEVIKIAKRLLKLRSEHFLPAMKASLAEYNEKGSPIIRPMWWSKNDPDAFTIDDQFFVGNDIIVAPIVDEGKTERDIYLPHGWWKDEILAQVIRGGKWMRKYQVPLDKVAFFVRTEPSPPST